MNKYEKNFENFENLRVNYKNNSNNTSNNFSTHKISNNSLNQKRDNYIILNEMGNTNSVNNITNNWNTPNFGAEEKNKKQRKSKQKSDKKIKNVISLNEINEKFKEWELILNLKKNKKDVITFKQFIFILNYLKLIDINSKNKLKIKTDHNFVESVYSFLIKDKLELLYNNIKSYLVSLLKIGNKLRKNNVIKINSKKDTIIDISIKNPFKKKKNISFNKNLSKDVSLMSFRKKKSKKIIKKNNNKKACKIKKIDNLNAKNNIKIKIKKSNKSIKSFKSNENKNQSIDLYKKNNFSFYKNKKSCYDTSKEIIKNNLKGNEIIDDMINKINENKNYFSEKRNTFNYSITFMNENEILKINFALNSNKYFLYLPFNDKTVTIFEDFCVNNEIPYYIKINLLNHIKKKIKLIFN